VVILLLHWPLLLLSPLRRRGGFKHVPNIKPVRWFVVLSGPPFCSLTDLLGEVLWALEDYNSGAGADCSNAAAW
jgi:hypothetical protein